MADRLNNRVLRFASAAPVPPVIPPGIALKGRKKISTSKATITLRGTATRLGRHPPGVSYNLNDDGYVRAKGTTNWKAKIRLPIGRNKIIFNSVALDGQVSPPLKVIVTRR